MNLHNFQFHENFSSVFPGTWLVPQFRIDRFLPHLFQFIIKKGLLSMLEVGGACRTYRGGERCIKSVVGKPEKETTWKIQSAMEDNTEMYIHKIGWGVD
jgi:hypothetical protein